MRPGSSKPLSKRFEGKVFYSPCGCHLWTGKTEKTKGYGEVGINGKIIKAHRLAYMVYRGEIPNGIHVLHSCDTPLCVNPDHLRLGTRQDNMDDKVKRQRQHRPIGTINPKSKLNEDDVLQIRFLKGAGFSCEYIAGVYGICRASVYMISNRITWKHI